MSVRKSLVLGLCMIVSAHAAHAVEKDHFVATTARDLVQLCSVEAGDPHHDLAKGYCLGYVGAATDYHGVIARSKKLPAVSCPPAGTTRQDVIDMFLSWASRNQGLLDVTAPLDGLMQAAHQKWPCEGK